MVDDRCENREILCVVTGMEHSGTTYLSKILSAHPEIMSGFECGLLLSNIKDYQKVGPWYTWMQDSADTGQWGILPKNMKKICNADTYYEAYHLIKQYSGDNGSEKIKNLFRNASYIIDKTPAYVYSLETIMGKINVPFLVVRKDIVTQYKSYKKRGQALHFFVMLYMSYMSSLKKALEKYPDRVMVIDHGELLKDKPSILKKVYAFLGVPCFPESTMEGFFAKTGFKKDMYVNPYGGVLNTFSEKHLKFRVTKTERILLKLVLFLKRNSFGVILIKIAIATAGLFSNKQRRSGQD